MNIPEIPPYNPANAKKRRAAEEAAGHNSKLPGMAEPQRPATTNIVPLTPSNANARPTQAYAPPVSSNASATKASHRNSAAPSSSASSAAPSSAEAAHPSASSRNHASSHNRPRVCFGPYTLLHTLGEGEFGKVKLGVRGDARWGEEVAIKLIKRGSIQGSDQRLTKVRREIDVLRAVKHPYIVRLYDVIETEKYIGIVLEYANGGELFDHILAHRYLKDKDAQRLFAQLVSAVDYLHEKKIVHRDLKLENLLLDRKRNIIVTDFGFANRFEDKQSDLMATSCGSPCYAAPELVVQDGKYVGSAVDVWSCGVILYAMLAGYLPFDDDPMNPDSENINLLYKYIINTKLTFPEWISALARDLLNKMLVPDPTKRCGLDAVMQHEWLKDYQLLFNKSVDDVEDMARKQDEERHAASERQKQAVLQQEEAAQAGVSMSRSHSSSVANPRHQSAVVVPTSATSANLAASHLGTTSARPHTRQQSPAAAATTSSSSSSDKRRAHAQSAVVVPSSHSKAGFAEPATSNAQATAGGFTFDKLPPISQSEPQAPVMQPSASAPSRPETTSPVPVVPSAPSKLSAKPKDEAEEQAAAAKKRRTAANRYTVQVEYDPQANSGARSTTSSRRNSSQIPVHVSNPASPTSRSTVAATEHDAGTPTKIPVRSRTSSAAAPDLTLDTHQNTTPAPRKDEVAFSPAAENGAISTKPAAETELPSSPVKSSQPPQQRSQRSSVPFPDDRKDGSVGSSSTRAPSARSKASRHAKGASVVSIARFLPGSSTSQAPAQTSEEEVEVLGEAASERRKSRRKALSLVVDPFKSSSASTRTGASKRSSARIAATQSAQVSTPATPARTRATSTTASSAAKIKRPQSVAAKGPTTAAPSSSAAAAGPAAPARTQAAPSSSFRPAASNDHATPYQPQHQQGKAKKVMDWFRWKSMPRDTSMSETDRPIVAPITDFDKPGAATSSQPETNVASAPHVVVTPEARSAAAQPEPTPQAAELSRDASMASARTTATADTTHSGSQEKPQEPFMDNKLRFHQGAVDQHALTSFSPPGVLLDLRKTLFAMGIDAREEGGSAYRLKCVRQSSKKTAAAYGMPVQALHGQSLNNAGANSGLNFSQGPSGRVVNSASLAPSPSSTFRALFTRRGSSQSTTTNGGMPSPALSTGSTSEGHNNAEALASSLARSNSTSSQSGGASVPLPFFGQDDPGAEVRFTVEISRIKGLPNLYAIDIRRLKGNLWSYRAIYHEIISRTPLS